VAAARQRRRQRQRGSGSMVAAAAVVGQRLKDASGDTLEGQAGWGAWRSLSSWDVEFLVEFRTPLTWGDAPRGGRAKAKTKVKATLTATVGQTVTGGRKETT
jgi:hypothetical protein